MPDQKSPFLNRVQEALRVRHYSIRTEKVYLDWTKRFILFHHKQHPENMAEKTGSERNGTYLRLNFSELQ